MWMFEKLNFFKEKKERTLIMKYLLECVFTEFNLPVPVVVVQVVLIGNRSYLWDPFALNFGTETSDFNSDDGLKRVVLNFLVI